MTQTVPDISPLMPMHQDPLLVENLRSDIEYALFHVMNIFRGIYAMAWYARSVIKYVVDNHAPVKYNLSHHNQCRIWIREKNRRLRNLVVTIRKNFMRRYFEMRFLENNLTIFLRQEI